MATHLFNIEHQQATCSSYRNTLQEDDLWQHVNFSENWQVKRLYEVQSAHFGASHSQITIHTGVAYSSGKDPVSFCSISDDQDHSPRAIWKHLVPVLEYFKGMYPHMGHLHVQTDGPVTQYRGRGNMNLLANIPFLMHCQVLIIYVLLIDEKQPWQTLV